MRYDIREQLGRHDAEITLDVNAPVPPGTDVEFVGNVTGRITLRNLGKELAAWGRLSAVALLPCARCMTEHEVPLDFDFTETVALAQIDEPLSYTQITDDDESAPIPILDGGTVDLNELVRQLLVLHAPIRSVCRPDCRGLCPECGIDLNLTTCDCGREEIDPRLAPLRKLLQ